MVSQDKAGVLSGMENSRWPIYPEVNDHNQLMVCVQFDLCKGHRTWGSQIGPCAICHMLISRNGNFCFMVGKGKGGGA